MKIDRLTLEEKIGQLFVVGLEGKTNQEIINLIQENKIGGIVLYKHMYRTYQEMLSFINNIKTLNSKNSIPIFISIDQEGGRVNRMPQEILNIKSATKLANTNNIEIVKESGKIIGEMLNKTGISMDYAPVLDIRRFEEKHAIGDRCYGENKEEVSKYGIEVMKEIQKQGVIPVVKHFPGHGLTEKDSHFRIPKIKEKIEILEKEDMLPFEKAIKENAEAVMIGHLIIKDIDKKYPASLSKKVIQKYLIEKYNYKGLIITDDFKMMAIRIHYNMKKAVFKAIEAGNDIILTGLSYKKIKKIIRYIIKKVEKGKIDIERINKSLEKIIAIKEKYNIEDKISEGFSVEDINRKIKELNGKLDS